MKDQDPRKDVLENLKYDSCKIIHTDKPIVLLCGGIVKEKIHLDKSIPPDESTSQNQSLRHALTNEFTDFEFFRPEEVTNWLDDAVFKNLVDLEKELAAICSLVVIILESPGAIAELGAFSQLDELKNKLLVIMSSNFNKGNNSKSFINLGVLRHIKDGDIESVKIFPWNIKEPSGIEKSTIEDTISGVKDRLSKIKQMEKLNVEKDAHITTVVCELIRIFVALKEVEIVEYLNHFNIPLSSDKIRRKLFLLERFNLIKISDYDSAKYYCRTKDPFNKLRLSAKKGKLEDVNVIINCMDYYTKIKDRHRLSAIKEFKKDQANESV